MNIGMRGRKEGMIVKEGKMIGDEEILTSCYNEYLPRVVMTRKMNDE